MKFVGTSSAFGIPSPFCNCKVCQNARTIKGKEVRTRSMFLLDEKVMIDFSPDHLSQSVNENIDLSKLEHILFTHTHADHISSDIFLEKMYIPGPTNKALNLYFVDDGYKYITDFYPLLDRQAKDRFDEKHCLAYKQEFYQTFNVLDYKVTAFKGKHTTDLEKYAANYLIEKNNHKMYYALDSGYFYDETFDHLKDQHLNIFVGELTFPTLTNKCNENSEHMDINMFIKNLNKLYEIKAIDDNTKVYATHISCTDMNHEEIVNYFKTLNLPYVITIAYDGLEIEAL